MLGPTIQFYQCLDQNCVVHTVLISLIKDSSVEQQTSVIHIYSCRTEVSLLDLIIIEPRLTVVLGISSNRYEIWSHSHIFVSD